MKHPRQPGCDRQAVPACHLEATCSGTRLAHGQGVTIMETRLAGFLIF